MTAYTHWCNSSMMRRRASAPTHFLPAAAPPPAPPRLLRRRGPGWSCSLLCAPRGSGLLHQHWRNNLRLLVPAAPPATPPRLLRLLRLLHPRVTRYPHWCINGRVLMPAAPPAPQTNVLPFFAAPPEPPPRLLRLTTDTGWTPSILCFLRANNKVSGLTPKVWTDASQGVIVKMV